MIKVSRNVIADPSLWSRARESFTLSSFPRRSWHMMMMVSELYEMVVGSLVRISAKLVLGGVGVLLSSRCSGSFAARGARGAGVLFGGVGDGGLGLERCLSVVNLEKLEGSLYGLFLRLSFSKMGEVVENLGGELIGDGGMMLVVVEWAGPE